VHALKLREQSGRRKGDFILKPVDDAKRVGQRDFGVRRADANAFSAVDAAFI
jgi:hypothetical protein